MRVSSLAAAVDASGFINVDRWLRLGVVELFYKSGRAYVRWPQ